MIRIHVQFNKTFNLESASQNTEALMPGDIASQPFTTRKAPLCLPPPKMNEMPAHSNPHIRRKLLIL
jgi:hypothetical protein